MSKIATIRTIGSAAILVCSVAVASAGGMVKDGSGHPVMGVTQPMMAEKMDKMDNMEKKPMMNDKMDKKPMMDDKMKK